MKRLIIVALVVSALCGCVGERHQMTPEQQKAFLAEQKAQHDQELATLKAEATAQGKTVEQVQDEQQKQALNAELERSQEKYDREQRERNYERLCEAAHPYMMDQCMVNAGINGIVDSM